MGDGGTADAVVVGIGEGGTGANAVAAVAVGIGEGGTGAAVGDTAFLSAFN